MQHVVVSFSGGKTSAFLCRVIREHEKFKHIPATFIFANTGKESEETLRFVDECDRRFGLDLAWVEAVIHPEKGVGTTHRLVSYSSASRNGEPYEAMLKKYGLPSKAFPHCTRELKIRPITSYMRGITRDYHTAIGIRADERHRIGSDPKIIYPLANDFPVDKDFINRWWARQEFTLQLSEEFGNCDLCFKKSLRKKLTVLAKKSETASWWLEMEERYGNHLTGRGKFNQRENKTISELLEMAMLEDFEPFRESQPHSSPLDLEWSCICKST